MKKVLLLFLCIILSFLSFSQENNLNKRELSLTNFSNRDSLEALLPHMNEDTLKAIVLSDLGFAYAFSEAEKGLYYGKLGLQLSQKMGYQKGIANNTLAMSSASWSSGNYENALRYALDALHQFEILKDHERTGFSYVLLSITYRDAGDFENALINSWKSLHVFNTIGVSPRISYANLGSIYELQSQLDSALYYTQKSHDLDLKDNGGKWDWVYWILGNIEAKKQNYPAALLHYRRALSLARETNILKTIVEAHNGIAQVYKVTGNIDSCIYYASEVIQKWQSVSYQKGVLEAAKILANAYKIKNSPDSAIKYLEFSIALNDKLFNQQRLKNIQSLGFSEQMRLDEIERNQKEYRNQLKLYGLIAIGLCLFITALFLWRNNLHRKKAYNQLQTQKAETEVQKDKAEAALEKLQATQKQLIQSEKMASLGELTAGIAHEIQNPLNFVNNFSELNQELTNELDSELAIGHTQLAKDLVADIKTNSEKINQHGQRASSIVKGMLEHSRKSSGEKTLTDINALCDEYLRLSYHGLRARDKNFQCDFKLELDPNMPKINVVSQDIARVLLNIMNNAFQACHQKQQMWNKKSDAAPSLSRNDQELGSPKSASDFGVRGNNANYSPLVVVNTKYILNKIEITISDNGPGIPDSIKDKIFQPIFTTKPTGQGTGLGLSLAYDILKAQGGVIKVESIYGKGTEFIISLPVGSL